MRSQREDLEKTLGPIIAGIVVLLTLIGVLGTATHDPRPHDIAVGLAGPAPVVQQMTTSFAAAAPGAFRFTTYDSEASARSALDARDVVAALVAGSGAPRLIVAGAAGDAITGGVTAAFTNAFRAQNVQLAVEVVHPFQSGDPHGIAVFFFVLAILISTVVATAILTLRDPSRGVASLAGVIVLYCGLAGIFGAIATGWIVDGYGDRLWQVAALGGLLSLAVGAATAAGARLFGTPGVALAALVVVLLGLVSSGGPLGSELLPDAYRALAPWMPAGQAYSALRGALYFDGAGVSGPAIILTAWSVAGFAVLALSGLNRIGRRTAVVVPA
jgi:hypothetical protein